MKKWVDPAIAAALALLSVLWSRKILGLWWTFDDPFHINLIANKTVGDLLFGRELWRNFPSHVFTPLLLLSLKADLAIAGASARAFYVHHIISFACLAPLLYLLLRQWVSAAAAACGALIAIAGTPMIECVLRLMDRHYIEGLLFTMLAAIAFARGRSALSAALYLVAMSAKEIFVPLPLVLAFIPGRPKMRTHVIALGVYAIWRMAVLGPSLESYGWAVRPREWPLLIATMPWRVLKVMSGGNAAGWIAVALLLFALALIRARLLVVVALAAALLPIVPVSFEIHPRYALAAWLLLAVGAAFVRRPLGVVALIAVVVAARIEWAQSFREAKRMSDEARVFAVLNANDVLWLPATPPATLDELARLTHSPGRWTYDDLPLCAGRMQAARFFAYDRASRAVRPLGAAELMKSCAAMRRAPLSVRFQYEHGGLFWDLGPYRDGRYRVVIADGRQGFDVPPHAGFKLAGIPALPLRVEYEAPAGWTTESDDLQVALSEGRSTTWQR